MNISKTYSIYDENNNFCGYIQLPYALNTVQINEKMAVSPKKTSKNIRNSFQLWFADNLKTLKNDAGREKNERLIQFAARKWKNVDENVKRTYLEKRNEMVKNLKNE